MIPSGCAAGHGFGLPFFWYLMVVLRWVAWGATFQLGNMRKHDWRGGEMMNGWYCWKLWERALLETSLGNVWEHSATASLLIHPRGKA